MKRENAHYIVIANDLLTGVTVYLARDKGWTERVSKAAVSGTLEEARRLEQMARLDEASNRVVGVYLVPVDVREGGEIVPHHFRERMRVRAYPSFWAGRDQEKLKGAFRVSI